MTKLIIRTVLGLGAIGLAALGFSRAKDFVMEKTKERLLQLTNSIKQSLIGEIIILDSNIWMLEDSDKNIIKFFYYFCEQNNIKILIPSFQLKEFQNPKDDKDRYLKKRAKERIEMFQDAKIVKLENFNQKFSYIDDSLLDYLLYKSRSVEKISFITEDRELRIKAKAIEEIGNKMLVSKRENYVKLATDYLNLLEYATSANSGFAQ